MPLRHLLDLLVPPRCLACGAPAGTVCGACRRALRFIGPACPRCALPAPCGDCPARGAPWSRAIAAVAFEGPARELVHALKYDRHLAAADVMAAPLARAVGPADGFVLVPAPAHPARVRRQGFDHGVVLARALGARLGLPVVAALERHGPVLRQVEAGSAAERRGAARVRLTARGPIPDRVLLVDDVHTTGATLRAGAAALRDAGARTVHVSSYARTYLDRVSNM